MLTNVANTKCQHEYNVASLYMFQVGKLSSNNIKCNTTLKAKNTVVLMLALQSPFFGVLD
jgi:hypothetical protein